MNFSKNYNSYVILKSWHYFTMTYLYFTNFTKGILVHTKLILQKAFFSAQYIKFNLCLFTKVFQAMSSFLCKDFTSFFRLFVTHILLVHCYTLQVFP